MSQSIKQNQELPKLKLQNTASGVADRSTQLPAALQLALAPATPPVTAGSGDLSGALPPQTANMDASGLFEDEMAFMEKLAASYSPKKMSPEPDLSS